MKQIFWTLLLLVALVAAAPAAADDWFVQLEGGNGQGFGGLRSGPGGLDFSFVTYGIGDVTGATINGSNAGGNASDGTIVGSVNIQGSEGANVVVNGTNGSVSGTLQLVAEGDGGGNGGDDDYLEDDTTDPCADGPNTVCLQDGRFEITATYNFVGGQSGDMGATNTTDDTGQLHFLNPDNVEVFIKVLDACSHASFPYYWVFISGMTNQGVELKVRDSVAGKSRTYTNPAGTTFVTVTGNMPESGAFDTCDGGGQ